MSLGFGFSLPALTGGGASRGYLDSLRLLEDGYARLLESGGNRALESGVSVLGHDLLLESLSSLLLEDSTPLLMG
jgi:hypothetical protein